MAIEYTYTPTKVSGDGSTTDFDFTFKIYQTSDVGVQLIDKTTDVATDQSLGADYSVEIDLVNGGGTITFTSAPSSSYWVFIYSNLDNTQPVSFPLGGKLKENDVEQMGDRAVQLIQQLVYNSERKFGFAISSTDEAPDVPALEAGKYLYTDGSSLTWRAMTLTETQYDGTIGVGLDVNKPSSPVKNDLYFATDTKKKYFCVVDGSWNLDGVFDTIEVSGAITTSGSVNIGGNLNLNNTTLINAFLDEDDMSSDSATGLPTQQSVKAYADSKILTCSDWVSIDTYVVGGTGVALTSGTTYQASETIIVRATGTTTASIASFNIRTDDDSLNVTDVAYITDAYAANAIGDYGGIWCIVPKNHYFRVEKDSNWSDFVMSTRPFNITNG